MTKEIVKEGFALAEKSEREKQVNEVKLIVLKTLEKKRAQEKIRDEAIAKIKVLNMDIEDLRDGKLDRIAERQEKDEQAKQTSVVIIIKEKEVHHHYDYWHYPYRIVWQEPFYVPPITSPKTALGSISSGDVYQCQNNSGYIEASAINCSIAKDATVGAYALMSNEVIHVR